MGQEFQVNTYQENWQRNADVTTFADGSFLIVWESYFNNYDDNPSATYIAAQRYDANGARVGSERRIDFVDFASSASPSVVALSDGGYAVAYCFDNQHDIIATEENIYVNIYNANGKLRVADIRVDSVASNAALSPEVVALGNGGFRVNFYVSRSTTNFDDVYSRTYDRLGRPVGTDTLTNTNVRDFDQGPPESATLRDGTTITMWRSEASFELGTALDANEFRGTLTTANSTVIRGDFTLGEAEGTITAFGNSSGLGFDIAALANGGFVISHVRNADEVGVVAGEFDDTIVIRMFDAVGGLTANDIPVWTTDEIVFNTSVTQLATGEIVVVWEQYAEDDAGFDVMGRVLSSDGQALTGRFEIGVDRFENDDQESPTVRALAGGGFVVTYMSFSIDADDDGIAARIYGRATAGDDRIRVDQSGMMLGLAGNDTITGSGRSNCIMGGGGNDRASGLAGADRMGGGAGRDVLVGGDGNDTLTGGLGNDTLTGNVGADRFVFGNPAGAANSDHITSFATDDVIALDNAVFRALGAAGTLNASLFKMIGTGASADAGDRLIYDKRNGVVYYDTNGSGDGGRLAIVDLDNRPTLTAGDFLIV